MELLRVFNKKRLCIFGLMIILNAVLFIMGNKINEQEIIYRDLVNSYNDNISITEMSKNTHRALQSKKSPPISCAVPSVQISIRKRGIST